MLSPSKLIHWAISAVFISMFAMPVLVASSIAEQIEAIYQPLRVEQATLAPDGHKVAFATRDQDGLHAVVYDVDNPDITTRRLLDPRADVRLQFLGWAGPDQLVVATDASQVVLVSPRTRDSKVLADVTTFGGKENDNSSIVVRVVGLSDNTSSVTLEVRRFVPPSLVVVQAIRVSLPSGERTVLNSSRLDVPGGEIMADQQGNPRLLFDRGASPQSFNLLSSTAGTAEKPVWNSLDRLVAGQSSHAFNVTPESFLGERSFPLAFDYNPSVMYFASNHGRDTYGIYSLNLSSGRSIAVLEDPSRDLADIHQPLSAAALIFDRASRSLVGIRQTGPISGTKWFDKEMAVIQDTLEEKFRGRQIQILDWDDRRARFLLLLTSDRDPGRYFVYHRGDGHCVEYFRRALLDADDANSTEVFNVTTAAGTKVSGFLTRPHAGTDQRPGLVIWFHDGPWQQINQGFQADAQALAAMGFIVAQINYRGSTGFGRQYCMAIQEGFDRLPVEDAIAAVDTLAKQHRCDSSRVAVVGEGFGGFLALRAIQLHPQLFRCAVALDAPLDLDWPADLNKSESIQMRAAKLGNLTRSRSELSFLGNGITSAYGGSFERNFVTLFFQSARLQKISVDARPELFIRPVLLLHDPQNQTSPIERLRRLVLDITRRKGTAQLSELPPLFLRDLSIARVEVFKGIGDFLRTNLNESDPASALRPILK